MQPPWYGNPAAREQTIQQHLPLVQSVVHRWRARFPAALPLDDVIACGIQGLSHAVDTYDSRRSAFLDYAARKIDEALRTQMIRQHVPLVRRVAQSLRDRARLPAALPQDDVIASGHLGLIDAVDTYDPTRSAFRRYAAWKIAKAILNSLVREHLLKIPRDIRTRWRHVLAAHTRLMQQYRCAPEPAEIATTTQLTLAQVEEALRDLALLNPESLDALLEAAPQHAPVYDPQAALQQQVTLTSVEQALDSLSSTKRQIIVLFYYEGQSLQEIATRLGRSVGYVKGTKSRAEGDLRKFCGLPSRPQKDTL